MQTITTKTDVYKFNELPEEAKEKALEHLWDINISFEWWEFTYEDAENVGLKLTGFDMANYCNGEFLLSANEVALNISNNHGGSCETFKTSESFMEQWQPLFDNYMSTEEGEQELIDCEEEYLKSILEDYRIMLIQEYEYQSSEKSIIETIEAIDYDFTLDGKIFS